MLKEHINNNDDKRQHFIEKKVHKKVNKNSPKNIDINLMFIIAGRLSGSFYFIFFKDFNYPFFCIAL